MMGRIMSKVFGSAEQVVKDGDPYAHLRNERGYVDLHTAGVPCPICKVAAMTLCKNEYGDVCFERSQAFLKWAKQHYEDYKALCVEADRDKVSA